MINRHRSGGFGLVEIMVGVVIGIVASLAIVQVFAVSERQKRATSGAADTQTNGAIAMYMLERDVRMAGWGMDGSMFANCNNTYTYYDSGSVAGPLSNLFASVTITDGGTNPDSIQIQYYDDPASQNYKFSMTTLRGNMPQPSSELNVNSTYTCDVGDLAIVQQGGNCTLMQITQKQEAALKLQHNPGGSPTYNPPANYQNANGWPTYTTGATLQCFSSRLFTRTYRVVSEQLELLEPDNTNTIQTYQVAPEIVDLKAQYGVANTGSQQVTQWVDATGAWTAPLSATDTRRIKAVRIAAVARSAQYEKPGESGTCETTTASMVSNWSTWATFSTANYPADWQCYRYRVFETVVPLRNIIWAKT